MPPAAEYFAVSIATLQHFVITPGCRLSLSAVKCHHGRTCREVTSLLPADKGFSFELIALLSPLRGDSDACRFRHDDCLRLIYFHFRRRQMPMLPILPQRC